MERALHSQHRDTPFSRLMLWRCSSISTASCTNPSTHLDFLARMLVLVVMFTNPASMVTNLSGVHFCTSARGCYICLAVLGPGCLWWDRGNWKFSWVGGCLDVWIAPCWSCWEFWIKGTKTDDVWKTHHVMVFGWAVLRACWICLELYPLFQKV